MYMCTLLLKMLSSFTCFSYPYIFKENQDEDLSALKARWDKNSLISARASGTEIKAD